MRFFPVVLALSATLLLAPALAESPSPQRAVTCVIAVSTPAGMICVHKDGTVAIPAEVKLDRISRQFWEEVAKQLPASRDLFCEWFRDARLR